MENTSEYTIVDRFRTVEQASFGQELDRVWIAISEIKNTVVEKVENGDLPVLTGLGIVASVTSQALGYGLFAGMPAPADLMTDLFSPRTLAAASGR